MLYELFGLFVTECAPFCPLLPCWLSNQVKSIMAYKSHNGLVKPRRKLVNKLMVACSGMT